MNDIDKMPSKCRDCPYWELASYPWYCGGCVEKMNPKNGEYIKRIDAKRALTALPPDLDAETVQRCIEAMNSPKAADVEPVVRCRDCKFASMTYDGECKYCACFASKDEYGELDPELYLPGDFFCAFGERKEADDAE